MMIKSFGNKVTSDFYNGISNARVRKLSSDIKELALYKLDVLNSVISLNELKSPPGNRFEALKGDYAGFHSIRINSQWRIIFRWEGNGAYEVQIIDYH